MKSLQKTAFKSDNGIVQRGDNDSITLVANRATIGEKFFPEKTKFSFCADIDSDFDEYIVIEYSCIGIARPSAIKPSLFSLIDKSNNSHPLFIFDDIVIDNSKHTLAVKAPKGDFCKISVEFFVDKVLSAHFMILHLFTCKECELSENLCSYKEPTIGLFSKINLSDKFNASRSSDEFDSTTDSYVFFDKSDVSLYGIPFSLSTDKNNVIAPPACPEENEESIVNFGAETKRGLCRPKSRDGKTVIEIGKNASEIYFILTLSKKHHIRTKYGTGGEVLGTEYIDILKPLAIDDIEFFMAEVVYEDTRRDTHLPLNVPFGKHGVFGDASVYAIPCDGSKVKELIIHNRMLDADVCLAAVTVNDSTERLFPQMLIPEKKFFEKKTATASKGFTLNGNELKIKNGALSMLLDLSDGLYLKDFESEFSLFSFTPAPMLRLRGADGTIYDKFSLCNAEISDNCATISLEFESTLFMATFDISESNNIKATLNVTNRGEKEFKKGIIFPYIGNCDFGSFSENRYFVPKYQNLDSDETFYMYEESAPSFPMQFMDIYSPSQHSGIAINTREMELLTRKYCLKKDKFGLEMYVEYPIIYSNISPNESLECSECTITCHDGDWREAFSLYKTWLDRWYVPYKCQNKQWYRECFWLLAEITDFFETNEITKFPCWYDSETGEFNFRKILEEQKGISGVYPDILHMWSWCNQIKDGVYRQKWGNYGEEDYNKYGGKEKFKNALHDIRDNMGVQVSLYLHPTLLTESYTQWSEFLPQCKVITESGGNISIFGNTVRMCHAEESWRNHALSMYPRIYEDLKIPLLYVDEFSLRIENRCYAKNHGHAVPSNLLKTDRDFITKLKDIMPEEVVLYGEYAAADVNARYIDCNISYYILDSIVDMIETAYRAWDGDDTFSRVFTNVYRFAFPKIVQLILPMAMRKLSWHPQKFLFFNGEAIYDSFWDCEESRGLDFTVKAYKLKKKYADCFTSDCPQTMIETLSDAICMNKFPSKDRVLYTVYNRAYSTFRGNVLRVPYVSNARYYDAWNERELTYTVKDGFAEIYLEIPAQEIGCIVIE